MASLDFAYDLLEKLNEEKMGYALVVIQKGKGQYKADIFHNIHDTLSRKVMLKALAEAKTQVSIKPKKKK